MNLLLFCAFYIFFFVTLQNNNIKEIIFKFSITNAFLPVWDSAYVPASFLFSFRLIRLTFFYSVAYLFGIEIV